MSAVTLSATGALFNTPGLLATFSGWFAHLCFAIGRGPITPSGPEMVVIDRKYLN